MRRKLSGLTALLLIGATFFIGESEAGQRAHCRRECRRLRRECYPAPFPPPPPATATIDCPQNLASTANIGGINFYTYSCSQCPCNSNNTPECQNTGTTQQTYSPNEISIPETCSSECSYSSATSKWTCGNNSNCIIIGGGGGPPAPAYSRGPKVWTVPNSHAGKNGIDKYADPGNDKVQAQGTFSENSFANVGFQESDTKKQLNAFVSVIMDVTGTPLFAVGYEQKKGTANAFTLAVPPDSGNCRYLYEITDWPIPNDPMNRSVKLSIYTKNNK
jgi:hypothetical protein